MTSTRSTRKLPQEIIDSIKRENLSKENMSMIHILCNYMTTISDKSDEQIGKIEKLQSDVDKIVEMKEKISILEASVSSLKSKLDDKEQSERLNSYIMSGKDIPSSTKNENCVTVIQNVLHDIGLTTTAATDVSNAYRIGKRLPPTTPEQADKRPIVFNLNNKNLKSAIKKACKESTKDIYCNGNLTPTRSTISFVLRKLKTSNKERISGVANIDGNVYVWLVQENGTSSQEADKGRPQRYTMNTKDQLENFLSKFFNTTSSKFTDKWP